MEPTFLPFWGHCYSLGDSPLDHYLPIFSSFWDHCYSFSLLGPAFPSFPSLLGPAFPFGTIVTHFPPFGTIITHFPFWDHYYSFSLPFPFWDHYFLPFPPFWEHYYSLGDSPLGPTFPSFPSFWGHYYSFSLPFPFWDHYFLFLPFVSLACSALTHSPQSRNVSFSPILTGSTGWNNPGGGKMDTLASPK